MKKRIRIWLFGLALCWCAPLHALGLNQIASFNFGSIDYSPPPTGTISLGTNGTVAYTMSYAGSGNGIAGQIEIQENNGTVVEVSCEDATLASPGGVTLPMAATAVVGAGNTGAYGTTPACAGLGTTIATHAVGVGAAANTIYLGGRLTPTTLTGTTYATTNSGGQGLQVRVIIQ